MAARRSRQRVQRKSNPPRRFRSQPRSSLSPTTAKPRTVDHARDSSTYPRAERRTRCLDGPLRWRRDVLANASREKAIRRVDSVRNRAAHYRQQQQSLARSTTRVTRRRIRVRSEERVVSTDPSDGGATFSPTRPEKKQSAVSIPFATAQLTIANNSKASHGR